MALKQVLANIISNTEPIPGYHLICLEAPDIVAEAKAGQFVMLKCGDGLTLRRALSIHKVSGLARLYLLFKIIGKGTVWLSQCREKESLDVLGPLGNGFSTEPKSQNLLLVAGGIGIAPLTFLAQRALTQGKSVKLLFGTRVKDELYPLELQPTGIEIEVTTEDGSCGKKGKVSDVFVDYINWADQIYACGPKAMYETMYKQMQQLHIKKPIQVSLEVRMGCGLGACLGCSIKTRHGMKQVCQDGPVFNLEDTLLPEVRV